VHLELLPISSAEELTCAFPCLPTVRMCYPASFYLFAN